MAPAEFQAAGLWDPAAPNAAERLALLEWLAARGVTLSQLTAAHETDQLISLAGDLALSTERTHTLGELAALSGIGPERVQELRRAVGLPAVPAAERAFGPDDVRTYTAFGAAAQVFGYEATRRFSRVVGSSLARVAEAALSFFLENIEGPLRQAHTSEVALAQANLRAIELLDVLPAALQSILRQQMQAAIRRTRAARDARPRETATVTTAFFSIGFVDLVGFTPLSRGAAPAELAALVERFEDTANDVATARDGRVVKLIGDEVMFVAVDPGEACEIALDLMARLCCDVPARPRGGVAWGEMLLRGGDYYGPIVNLAARIAEQAVPDELLVTPELAARVRRPGLRFEPAGKRMLKGFDAPVGLMTVERG
jgi:adenylate cyclase